MSQFRTVATVLSTLVLLEACASPPMGPRVQVMPAPNKPFEVFQQDQMLCKQYADSQVGGQADAANQKAVGEALIGSALGAGLGAALGGGRGAAVGAATGGVMGSAMGAGDSQRSQMSIQQQYDNAFAQCMYSKGNQVAAPVTRTIVQPTVIYSAPPPPVVYAPPPAAVYAPPPSGGYYTPPPASGGYAPPPDAMYAPPPPPPPSR